LPEQRRSHTRAGSAFTALILETFRFNGALLAAGDRMTAPLGLSSARWQVLGAIEQGPVSVAQIARMMGIARQGVQRIADSLAQEGIVAYAPNPQHARAKLVCLTPKGTGVAQELAKRQVRWANATAAAASSAEIDAALRTVRCLRLRVERERAAR